MAKKIDLNHSVYELVMQYPELTDIMKELGFSEITKSAMLYSVGKVTTIPKGAKRKGIPMTEVVSALLRHGFEITGTMPLNATGGSSVQAAEKASSGDAVKAGGAVNTGRSAKPDADGIRQESGDNPGRRALLKSYLARLGSGEDLASVQADFKSAFHDVDAAEIMAAEQEMMAEGTPLTEVQKLCDLHSALFHGATKEEKILRAEETPAAGSGNYANREGQAKALEQIP